MNNSEYLFKLAHEAPDQLAAWLHAERGGMDAPKEDGDNDEFPPENVVSVAERARNANKAAQVVQEKHVRDATEMLDSREKLEADVWEFWKRNEWSDEKVSEWLDRQAEITRRTEQAEWIKQANGLIREANARADEFEGKYHDKWVEAEAASQEADELQTIVDRLTAERDEARAKCADLETEANGLVGQIGDVEGSLLIEERKNRELREKLSQAIGHAVEIMQLQDLEEGK